MRKEFLILLILILLSALASAQSRLSLFNSNYAGINGIYANPSSIVDSRYKVSATLFSFDAYVNNTYARFAAPYSPLSYLRNTVPDKYRDSTGAVQIPDSYLKMNDNGRPKKLSFGTDISGPSLMFRLSPKHSIAIGTRSRTQIYINNVSNEMLSIMRKGFNDTTIRVLVDYDNNINVNVNSYIEWNASYARILLKKEKHFLKGAITVKRLYGLYSAHVINKRIGYHITEFQDPNDTSRIKEVLNIDDIDLQIGLAGNAEFDNFSPADVFNRPITGKGWGFDLGFTYENRPDYDKFYYDMDNHTFTDHSENKYKYKIGIALVDIGSINYKGQYVDKYNITDDTVKVTKEQYKGLDSREEAIDTLISIFKNNGLKQSKQFVSGLPTALHFHADYKLMKHAYLGTVWVQDLRGRDAISAHAISNLAIIPRIEWAYTELSIPVSWINYHRLAIGAQLRLGPLIIGSDNIAALVNIGQPSGFDVYAGLTFNLLKKKLKDRDKDQVSDRNDFCVTQPGTYANGGCPDRDMDGIIDMDDACPGTPGLAIFKGCPDRDADGSPDIRDACPDDPGPIKFTGCPDTDNDLVMDKFDECPLDSGSIFFNGCPDRDKDNIPDQFDECPDAFGIAECLGCPPEREAEIQPIERTSFSLLDVFKPIEAEIDTLLLGKEIESLDIQIYNLQFESGKAILTAESYKVIDNLVAYLLSNPTYSLLISGHTDNVGKNKANLTLSMERSNAVKKAIEAKLILGSRLFTRGYGASRPIVDNTTEEGKKKNRRVELTIIK